MRRRTSSIEVPRCKCGVRVEVITSWTEKNPGRRFMACSLPKGEGCGYWEWYDPVMCYRSVEIIPGLLRRINFMESELKKLECRSTRAESETVKMEAKLMKLEAEKRKQKLMMKCFIIVVTLFLVMRYSSTWMGIRPERCVEQLQIAGV